MKLVDIQKALGSWGAWNAEEETEYYANRSDAEKQAIAETAARRRSLIEEATKYLSTKYRTEQQKAMADQLATYRTEQQKAMADQLAADQEDNARRALEELQKLNNDRKTMITNSSAQLHYSPRPSNLEITTELRQEKEKLQARLEAATAIIRRGILLGVSPEFDREARAWLGDEDEPTSTKEVEDNDWME